MVRDWVLYLFFLVVLVWVRPGRFRGGTCRFFRMDAVVGGCMSQDICPRICSGIAVSLSGGVIRNPIVVGWAEPKSEPQIKIC